MTSPKNSLAGRAPPPRGKKAKAPAGAKAPQRKKNMRSRSKGSESESAAASFLESRGWKILHRNKKICGVETDIIAQKQNACLLLEVKSLKEESYLEKILSPRQKKRLKRAAAVLADSLSGRFYFFLAAVSENPLSGKKEIRFYPID